MRCGRKCVGDSKRILCSEKIMAKHKIVYRKSLPLLIHYGNKGFRNGDEADGWNGTILSGLLGQNLNPTAHTDHHLWQQQAISCPYISWNYTVSVFSAGQRKLDKTIFATMYAERCRGSPWGSGCPHGHINPPTCDVICILYESFTT